MTPEAKRDGEHHTQHQCADPVHAAFFDRRSFSGRGTAFFVANITIGESIRSGAIEAACRDYGAEEGLELIDWDAPGNRTNRYPGSCTFEDPISGDVTYAEDSAIRVGAGYHVLVVLSSVISVAVLAIVLAVGAKLFGDD